MPMVLEFMYLGTSPRPPTLSLPPALRFTIECRRVQHDRLWQILVQRVQQDRQPGEDDVVCREVERGEVGCPREPGEQGVAARGENGCRSVLQYLHPADEERLEEAILRHEAGPDAGVPPVDQQEPEQESELWSASALFRW